MKDYQHHITRGKKAYCGAKIQPFEWAFVDLDHAEATIERNDRMQPCPECLKAAREQSQPGPDGKAP
jgi:hypothetical protein